VLLPAVQSARESGRRAQCANNMRQLGLALNAYHVTFKIFPPSSVWKVNGKFDVSQVNAQSTNSPERWENWVILTLPYLDQQNLGQLFDLTKRIADPANQAARSTQLSVMMCPSDTFNRQPFNGSVSSASNKLGDGWGPRRLRRQRLARTDDQQRRKPVL